MASGFYSQRSLRTVLLNFRKLCGRVCVGCGLALLSGCGVTPSVPNVAVANVSISVWPSSTSLNGGTRQQFTAKVSGAANTAVRWSATGGSISSAGLYTAPATAGSYTVTATSVADTTESASATVAVSTTTVVSVTISPTSASMLTGGTQQFSATVSGSNNTAVTWSATGGTVSASGLFTAPSTAGTYTITATSTANTPSSDSSTVIVSAPTQHTVTLTWTASTSTVSGYNVYRSTVSGSPYTRINAILDAATNYVDNTVLPGQTYYYVTTAVGTSGVESAYSNQITTAVPEP